MSVEPSSTAPSASQSSKPFFRKIDPLRTVPAGISTTPPPAPSAASIACWIATVLSVVPSPTALCAVMATRFASAANMSSAEPSNKPTHPIVRRSRRGVFILGET